jgi:hypothetical protein
MVDGRVVILDLVDPVVVLMADLLDRLQVWLLLMAFHLQHKVMLVVIFLVLSLVVLVVVDGEMPDLPLVVETELNALQHLETHLILMEHLDQEHQTSTLQLAVVLVDISLLEFLQGTVVVVMEAILLQLEDKLEGMVLLTLGLVEVVVDLTMVDLLEMVDLV